MVLAQVSWQDCPVECSRAFLCRTKEFLARYVLCKADDGPMFGRVLEHVVRYETQNRGSLHAHILLWVEADDIPAVTAEISATCPGELDAAGSARVCPMDPVVSAWTMPCAVSVLCCSACVCA